MAQHAFRRGFRGVVEGLAIARYSADTNSAALSLIGEPIEEEWTGVDGNAYQRCKRVTLRYRRTYKRCIRRAPVASRRSVGAGDRS